MPKCPVSETARRKKQSEISTAEFRALIKRAGMRIYQAAEYLGMTTDTMTLRLAGKRKIRVGEVDDIRALSDQP